MSQINDIKAELETIQVVKSLSNTFAELSALKISQIKKALAQNHLFYQDIQYLYQAVRAGAKKAGILSGIEPDTTITVAITSNDHFYGTQNAEIIKSFLKGLEAYPSHGLIIGITGKEIIEHNPQNKDIDIIIFKDNFPTNREMYDLLERFKTYEKVFLYHPKFINIMQQIPTVTDISYIPADGIETTSSFLYEPELVKIHEFFETHVRFLLFRRSLLEIDLARTAARLTAMLGAEDRAIDAAKQLQQVILRKTHDMITNRLQDTIRSSRICQKI